MVETSVDIGMSVKLLWQEGEQVAIADLLGDKEKFFKDLREGSGA